MRERKQKRCFQKCGEETGWRWRVEAQMVELKEGMGRNEGKALTHLLVVTELWRFTGDVICLLWFCPPSLFV